MPKRIPLATIILYRKSEDGVQGQVVVKPERDERGNWKQFDFTAAELKDLEGKDENGNDRAFVRSPINESTDAEAKMTPAAKQAASTPAATPGTGTGSTPTSPATGKAGGGAVSSSKDEV